MECHVDVMMSSEGANIQQVIVAMKEMGFRPVAGKHDFVFEYKTEEEYFKKLLDMHERLRGMKVSYRVESNISGQPKEGIAPWPWSMKF